MSRRSGLVRRDFTASLGQGRDIPLRGTSSGKEKGPKEDPAAGNILGAVLGYAGWDRGHMAGASHQGKAKWQARKGRGSQGSAGNWGPSSKLKILTLLPPSPGKTTCLCLQLHQAMHCGGPPPDVAASLLQEGTHGHTTTQHRHHTADRAQEQGLQDAAFSPWVGQSSQVQGRRCPPNLPDT